jgi:hypothetical protein
VKCKHRVYMRGWTLRNRERARELAKQSYARNAEAARERVRRYREQNLEKVRAYDRARGRRPESPEKRKARNALNKAVLLGAMSRGPCEVCGSAKTDGHHDDYSKPLDVRWLCRRHHGEVHRRVA